MDRRKCVKQRTPSKSKSKSKSRSKSKAKSKSKSKSKSRSKSKSKAKSKSKCKSKKSKVRQKRRCPKGSRKDENGKCVKVKCGAKKDDTDTDTSTTEGEDDVAVSPALNMVASKVGLPVRVLKAALDAVTEEELENAKEALYIAVREHVDNVAVSEIDPKKLLRMELKFIENYLKDADTQNDPVKFAAGIQAYITTATQKPPQL